MAQAQTKSSSNIWSESIRCHREDLEVIWDAKVFSLFLKKNYLFIKYPQKTDEPGRGWKKKNPLYNNESGQHVTPARSCLDEFSTLEFECFSNSSDACW